MCEKLWRKYARTRSIELRNQLVEHYMGRVRGVAFRLCRRLPRWVDREEAVTCSNIALLKAVEAFDQKRKCKFWTFALPRIRGAVLDFLRSNDYLPRLTRTRLKAYEKAVAEIRLKSDQTPTLREVANYLKIPDEDIDMWCADVQEVKHKIQLTEEGGLDDPQRFEDKYALTPYEECSRYDDFTELICVLGEFEQLVLTLYFRDEFTLKRISELFGNSESAMSQLMTKAIIKLRDALS